ncbi:hypothetical protein [Providencia phage PSTCR6]|nr:hypothetical protein [Providencia phage PSTCR6]
MKYLDSKHVKIYKRVSNWLSYGTSDRRAKRLAMKLFKIPARSAKKIVNEANNGLAVWNPTVEIY